MTKDNVCADCGAETLEENGPCVSCGSMRIVAIGFVEAHFGENWREAFQKEEKTPKQPRKPCATCPFTNKVKPFVEDQSALGGSPPEVYVGQIHLPFIVPCHEFIDYDDPEWHSKASEENPQCVGVAMCRNGQGLDKLMPDPILNVVHDPETGAFENIFEFWAYHQKVTVGEAKEQLAATTIQEMCMAEASRAGMRFINPEDVKHGNERNSHRRGC